MLQSPVVLATTTAASSHALRGVRRKTKKAAAAPAFDPDEFAMDDDMYDDEFDEGGGDDGGGKGRNKSRRELPTGAVATLKAWLLSPDHFSHPYPTPQDQAMLMQKTGIDKKQLKNWFTNARRRIWKPLLKKQIETGKMSGTVPTGFSGMPGPSGLPGSTLNPGASMDNPHSVQAVRVHYQQAMQEQTSAAAAALPPPAQTAAPVDAYGNPIFNDATAVPNQSYFSTDAVQLPQTSSMGTLAQVSSSAQMSKTDSHAVLMELFARDQDLVRQATESARLKAESKQQQQELASSAAPQQSGASTSAPTSQHPMMKAPTTSSLQAVPSLNSWPHFSSITSLNNLGTIPGVRSITSLSGADLASKGNLNKMGNIAQVKSMESLGKNDSYAFLEVFFGDRSSNNLSGMGGSGALNRGTLMGRQYGDEDNEIGLSLEDESPSHMIKKEFHAPTSMGQSMAFGAPSSVSSMGDHVTSSDSQTSGMGSDALKRAYDDALAARGLMSVSRSCEKLTDLVLPAKIQRTLSQEFINMQQEQEVRHQVQLRQQQQKEQDQQAAAMAGQSASSSSETQVQVSSTAVCASCNETNIDTQLRPCGHMFHERCLKPSLSNNSSGPPKCPICDTPIHSAVLAIPDNPDYTRQAPEQVQSDWSNSETLGA